MQEKIKHSNLTILISATLIFLTLVVSATPLHAASSNNSTKQQFFTTSPDGSEKKKNQFDSKPEVYLHSFEKNVRKKSRGHSGDYVYQVTTPNGRLLLSSDPAECRIVRVTNGVIVNQLKIKNGRRLAVRNGNDNCQTQNLPDGAAGSSQHHDTNTDTYSNGPALAVQLMPFFETTNPGNVYKVWMTPWTQYLRSRGKPFARPKPVCSTSRRKQKCGVGDEIIGFATDSGFRRNSSLRTHNFKVNPTSGNQPPIANAGDDKSTSLLSIVTLNGANSSDPDGNPLSYNWTITQVPAGSAASLSDNTASNPDFIIDVVGDYIFSLVVNDGTIDSSPDSVTISTLNSAPTANAGDDDSKAVGETITLDGSASSDSDGDSLSYLWEFVEKPSGSSAQLSDADSMSPTFILDVSGTYTIELIVNDGQLDSTADEVIISTSNSAPEADAGKAQSEVVGTVIQLDASGSTDIDGDSLSYFWSFTDKPDNSDSLLSDETAINPTFTLDAAGSYILQLTANDGQLDSTASVIISTVNSAPVADAGVDQSATINSLIDLDGSDSTDVDGDSLTYDWALTTIPENSSAVLSDSTAVMPSFTTDVVGDFVAQLTVSDGTLFSEIDTVRISFLNTAPVAEAGPAQSAVIGSIINLDGTGSMDADSDFLTYTWTLTATPEASEATLNDETSNNPNFTLDVSGEYQIQLIVNDGQVNSLPDTVTISTLNSMPVADAGDDLTTVAGTSVTLDGTLSNDADSDDLSYSWSLLNKPTGSNASITDTQTSMPTLTLTTDLAGTYIAQLIVNDGTVNSEPVTVTITATAANVAPVANAGTNDRVAIGEAVTLDGTASSDANGDTLTYQWQFTSTPTGSTAALDDATSNMPEFTADLPGEYVIELVVNDGVEDSLPSEVTITSGNTLTLSLLDELVGVGRTTIATATLEDPAPAGGQDITLVLDDTSLAELNPVTLNIPEGESTANFSITGLSPGLTELRGSADSIAEATATVQITQALVSIDEIDLIAPDETTDIVISLSEPAPPQGLDIQISILDSAIGTLSTITVSVPAGQVTPAANAEVTGINVGTTTITAQAVGYAPDVRDLTVALAVSFDQSSVNVTAPFTGTITLELDAPAPAGGITFDLTADDDIVSLVGQVFIPEGQTQSPPIELTGLSAGSTTLRANSAKTFEATAVINVDATEVYLQRSGQRITEALVGVDLQDGFQVILGATPPLPVDIKISVPENSGVLLSKSSSTAGSNMIVFDDYTGSGTPTIYIQGTAIGDDVPLAVEITEGSSSNTIPFAIDQITVDVDPSGLYMNTTEYMTTSFSNSANFRVYSSLLFDDETPTEDGKLLRTQSVRGGFALNVPMKTSDPDIVSLENGGTGNLSIANGSSSALISVTPVSGGEATISIESYPTGFALPEDRNAEVVITVNAPKAYLYQTTEAVVGLDLQAFHRLQFEGTPPRPVDVRVSVTANSGVLLSKTSTGLGQNSIMVVTNSMNLGLPQFYIQGETLGDNVPLTIEVFEAGTTTPIGYDEQTASVDVDPSGIYISTADFETTSFSNNTTIRAHTVLLHDDESTQASGKYRDVQALRGGISLTVPMTSSNPSAIALPDGATGDITITGGLGYGGVSTDPQNAGVSTISIDSLPGDFVVPSDRDAEVIAAVTAAQAYLEGGEAVVGKDLQIARSIRLAQAPPRPVDVWISAPLNSGVLLAKTGTEIGSDKLLVSSNSTSTFNHSLFIQGTALGDDIPLTIEVFETGTTTPIGYNIFAATADVDPAGLYLSTADIDTTTFANNSRIDISSRLLHDDETPQAVGSIRQLQAIRGGLSFTVPLISSDPNVVATADIIINGGSSSGQGFVDPLTAGSSTVSVASLPGDFIVPTNLDLEVLVTVTAPDAQLRNPSGGVLSGGTYVLAVGDELQVRLIAGLEEAPPAGNPVDIMVEVISDTVAVVSGNELQEGSGSVVFSEATTNAGGSIYVQGLSFGATQIKVSAPGYNPTVMDVEVVKSGFRLSGSASLEVGQSRNVNISAYRLNENNTISSVQAVRGGTSFDINLLSSAPAIGTVTSPITFGANQTNNNTAEFTAVSSGNTTVTIQQPTGFSPPAGLTSLDMTVN